MSENKELWRRCVEFHGHSCPGLAIGFRAALAARERLGATFSPDEEMVCVTENDACGVDAVQVITGCSVGKGNLLFRDTGKQAFSFFSRKDGRKVRVVFKMRLVRDENWDMAAAEKMILEADEAELFDFTEPKDPPPPRARIFASVVCEECGESAPENRIRIHNGKKVCLDCFPEYSRGW